MSRIVFQSEGLDKLIHDLDGYTKELNKEIALAMNENMEKVQIHARKNHRFKRVSGDLEKSVTVEYNGKTKNVHKTKIYLNDKFTTTENGKSYGTYQHEGTYQGYDQSPIAPAYPSSTSKSGNGIKGDPFLYRAIKQKWKMTRDLKKITAKLKKKYERV